MFSGIVGFGQYCAANTDPDGAMKIVKMLNELYTVFDALTDSKRNLNVYKVGQSSNESLGHLIAIFQAPTKAGFGLIPGHLSIRL